jgi:acid phosphatase
LTPHRFDALTKALSTRRSRRSAITAGLSAGLLGKWGARAGAQDATPNADRSISMPADVPIDHIIVIFFENHTFDNLYGLFAGADGLAQPDAIIPQVDLDGEIYETLPQPIDPEASPPAPDDRFPDSLPNAPFMIDAFVPPDEEVPSSSHLFYQHQLQINDGWMDRYVAWGNTGGLPMGYYNTTDLPLYPYARDYTLADNFFTAAFGGSMLNHFWLVCACTPTWPDAPADIVAQPELDADGNLVGMTVDGQITPDGYAVNTSQPMYRPYQAVTAASHRMPPQTDPTIGERLSEAGLSWAWYAGGWDDAMAGNPDPTFVYHHQPFTYFEQYADGTDAKAEHLKDENDFVAALESGSLPAVSFVKPIGKYDAHAGYSTLLASELHVVDLLERIKASPVWDRTAVILTYDDFGGWYDHVPPPVIDRWGPGGRVPTIIMSPFARRGFIDHTFYDHTSILKFIEWRYGLLPLTARDAGASNLLAAFDFGR